MDKYDFSKGFIRKPYSYPSGFDPKDFSIPGYTKIKSIPSQIDLGDRILKVINTPGHTPGSICLFDKKFGLLFTDDLLYEGPLYAFEEESNPENYLNSLREIAKLPVKLIHPGHNYSKNDPTLIYDTIELFEKAISEKKSVAKGKGRRLKVLV